VGDRWYLVGTGTFAVGGTGLPTSERAGAWSVLDVATGHVVAAWDSATTSFWPICSAGDTIIGTNSTDGTLRLAQWTATAQPPSQAAVELVFPGRTDYAWGLPYTAGDPLFGSGGSFPPVDGLVVRQDGAWDQWWPLDDGTGVTATGVLAMLIQFVQFT
jgi:hypothetical protein